MVNWILKTKGLSVCIKLLTLVVFGVILWSGFSVDSYDRDFLSQLRNTNLGNLLVWSLWWPAIVVCAIFFGRIWCMVCPVELITSFCSKFGLRQKPQKFIKSGWIIPIFYFIILFIGIHGYMIHRNPNYMAIYLLSIVIVAVIFGFIYEKNAFCRYVCPIGLVLGLYSKFSFFGLRVKDSNICKGCKDKSCIDKKHSYNIDCKSCGVGLYPEKINENPDCILCGGCVRTCKNYQTKSPSTERPNPKFKRVSFGKELFNIQPLHSATTCFIIILSGFIIYELWSEWDVTKDILKNISIFFTQELNINNDRINNILNSIILFALLPFAIWLIPYFIAKIFRSKLKLKDYLGYYAISYIPIVAAGHLCKAVLKSTSRYGYYEHLFNDIYGVSTAQQIIDKTIIIQNIPNEIEILISWFCIISILIGTGISFMIIRKLNQTVLPQTANKIFYLVPILYGGILLSMLIFWRF